MATDFIKKRNLKYLNKDFDSFKRDMVEHLKIYFPDYNSDFNEGSVGMMLTELCAFIGDNLSFYMDKKFEESFVESATEMKNVFKHAKHLGFKAFGKAPAVGKVDLLIKVPARLNPDNTYGPNPSYAGVVKKGARVKGSNGELYETLVDADFSGSVGGVLTTVGDINPTTKNPTSYILRKKDVDIRAGETKTTSVSVGSYESFKKITLTDDDIIEIIEVRDS